MRYIVSIILLCLSFSSLAMDTPDSRTKLQEDSQKDRKRYKNLIHNRNWSYFYEFVELYTELQNKEAYIQQEIDINPHAQELSNLIERCEEGFLGLTKQRVQFLKTSTTQQVLTMHCETIINLCVNNLPPEALKILSDDAAEKDHNILPAENTDIPLNNSVEKNNIPQAPANNNRKRQCIVS